MRWDHTPEEIVSITDSCIAEWTAIIDGIINVKEERTFKNIMEPLAKYEYNSGSIIGNIEFYHHSSMCKELREASLAAEKKFEDYSIELWMRYDFYEAIQNYKEISV